VPRGASATSTRHETASRRVNRCRLSIVPGNVPHVTASERKYRSSSSIRALDTRSLDANDGGIGVGDFDTRDSTCSRGKATPSSGTSVLLTWRRPPTSPGSHQPRDAILRRSRGIAGRTGVGVGGRWSETVRKRTDSPGNSSRRVALPRLIFAGRERRRQQKYLDGADAWHVLRTDTRCPIGVEEPLYSTSESDKGARRAIPFKLVACQIRPLARSLAYGPPSLPPPSHPPRERCREKVRTAFSEQCRFQFSPVGSD